VSRNQSAKEIRSTGTPIHSTTLYAKCTPSKCSNIAGIRKFIGRYPAIHPDCAPEQTEKMMHTISSLRAYKRSLTWSDTVTVSKARTCREMGTLLHSC